MEKNNDTDFIDEFFDNKENPLVENCSFIGLMESLIDNSLFDNSTKQEFMDRLDELRENDVPDLMSTLKSNQNIRDPKDQFKRMAYQGMFNEKKY